MVRLQDVAELAKVSMFSASKVMNGEWKEARISEECAARVQGAARELGYTPNYHAQSLSRRRSHTIGLVLQAPRFNDPDFTAVLVRGIEALLTSQKHDLLLVGSRGSVSELQHGLECLRQRRVDALIVPGCLGEMIWTDAFEAAAGVIVLAVAKPGSVHPAVDVDPAPGIDAAVGHLSALGHRRILWFTPDQAAGGSAVAVRTEAFAAAIAARGLRGEHAVFSTPGHLREGGEWSSLARTHFAGILQAGSAHTAVMCFNDATAVGVCLAAHDRGILVPQAFSVIGFDDFHGHMTIPRLTTISHELAGIGARAAELAIEMSLDPKRHRRMRGHLERIPARLVVRESTAPPRSSGAIPPGA